MFSLPFLEILYYDQRSVMLPCDRPVFVRPSRPDHQASVRAELVNARQVLADKEVAGIRPLHVMGHGVSRLVYVVAAEGGLVPVLGRIRWTEHSQTWGT